MMIYIISSSVKCLHLYFLPINLKEGFSTIFDKAYMAGRNMFETLAIVLIWQALLFAVLFAGVYFRARHNPLKYIALYMLANAAYFFVEWLAYFGHWGLLKYLYPVSIPLAISLLPLFYYYYRSLTSNDFLLRKKHFYHLIPSALMLILQLPFYCLDSSETSAFLAGMKFNGEHSWIYQYLLWIDRIATYLVFTVQFIFYSLKLQANLKLYRLRLELIFSYKENIDLRWMRYLFVGILLFFIGNDLMYLLRPLFPSFSTVFYTIGMLVINFFIGYFSLIQDEVFENEIKSRFNHLYALGSSLLLSDDSGKNPVQDGQKYQGSGLKSELKEQIISQLNKLMKETELFTDSQIGLDDLASRLNISSKSLSQAINEGYQKTFFNYINDLRIGKAMDMLQSDEHTNLSIEGIATVVGFQSKSSFYTAFKKNNGITPTEFRDKVKSQVSR